MNDIHNIDPQTAWQPFRPSGRAPWDHRLAAHLYRRAAFGATGSQLEKAVNGGMESSVEQLLSTDRAAEFNAQMEPAAKIIAAGNDPRSLSAWWLLQMAKTPAPLLEKMTLFWHGHFATSAAKVADPRAMYAQNNLLRKNALGKFEPMVQGVSRDVAMLVYLDSTDNRKTRPNENYARELMELFCLGPGNYTEQDIKQIARCFTGWEVRGKKFNFNSHQHDEGIKSFLGKRGNFGGEEAVRIVLGQPAAAKFIARKLIRFFVSDDLPISDELAKPIAQTLRDSSFDIKSSLRQIFSSQIFYSDHAIAAKIKSPVELAIGMLRFLEASTNMQQLASQLEQLGQLPLYPPNVKGWDGGRKWINASTILSRANLVRELVSSGQTKFADQNLEAWLKKQPAYKSSKNVDWLFEHLLPVDVPAQTKSSINRLAGQTGVSAGERVANVLSAAAALPEFQLN